jgi:hypothetical protein
MAEHEDIQLGWVNGQQTDVVVECFRREAEIHQEAARFTAALGLGVHRQTELANQRPAGRLVASKAPAKVLDIDWPHLLAGAHGELVAVNDDTN